jgi:ABC-2 type transport system permease protein
VVEGFAWQVSSGVVAGTVSVEHLLKSGKLDLADIMSYVQAMSDRLWEADAGGERVWVSQLISLRPETVAGGSAGAGVDWIMAYYAPSMAIMFLSFGVTQGARTILQEERTGTLGRLLTTPTRAASILGGKLLSTYVAGLLQFTILVGASSLLFGLSWGSPLAVGALSLALVGAMTSLGTVMAAFARSEGQVNTWGVAVLLVFSAVSGNLMPRFGFPAWLKAIGLLTPNAWALEGFTKLGTGGGLGDIWVELGALSTMAVLLFGLGVVRLGRRMTL